ncbi:hypothetical protein [Cobetia sp. ICG0124]|uniref:hypothetical protein n=1 Tax=Cobetia sp. ICG0124 TaxID=2053669 RepID=UPI00196B3B76|nr:hypothetical protein [Cobetia sp. ICG0124]
MTQGPFLASVAGRGAREGVAQEVEGRIDQRVGDEGGHPDLGDIEPHGGGGVVLELTQAFLQADPAGHGADATGDQRQQAVIEGAGGRAEAFRQHGDGDMAMGTSQFRRGQRDGEAQQVGHHRAGPQGGRIEEIARDDFQPEAQDDATQGDTAQKEACSRHAVMHTCKQGWHGGFLTR